MNLRELQAQLARYDLQPSRKLGQCFLVDENQASWIARQIDPQPADVVVEVGPGFGALTAHLAGKVGRLVLVEKDGRLVDFLRERYGGEGSGVEIVHGDATAYDPRPLFREGGVKFIGNLPYSSGNAILQRFLDAPSPVTNAVVMVQKEVADRLCAEPRSKDYGVLGLVMQERWDITHLKTIGPRGFHPQPEVDSSVVRLDPRSPGALPPHCPEVFVKTVKLGFSQRRKQLRNNLQIDREIWDPWCAEFGWKPGVRAEELSITEWVELANRIEPHPCAGLPPSSTEELEVVDANDEVTGRLPRREIHERKLLHRAVHVFVTSRHRDEIFLQKRSLMKDTHPGKWDSSASGHVDPGESYLACAERELWEEIWVRPAESLERVVRLEAGEETDQEFIEVFETRAAGRIRIHGKEIDCGRFFPVEEVERWIAARPEDFATGFRTCFGAWRRREKQDEKGRA